MEMGLEIEEEYRQFLEDIKDSSLVFATYMNKIEYVNEYPGNTIDEAMEILKEKIKTYLCDNRPGEFEVSCGKCIYVKVLDTRKVKVFR